MGCLGFCPILFARHKPTDPAGLPSTRKGSANPCCKTTDSPSAVFKGRSPLSFLSLEFLSCVRPPSSGPACLNSFYHASSHKSKTASNPLHRPGRFLPVSSPLYRLFLRYRCPRLHLKPQSPLFGKIERPARFSGTHSGAIHPSCPLQNPANACPRPAIVSPCKQNAFDVCAAKPYKSLYRCVFFIHIYFRLRQRLFYKLKISLPILYRDKIMRGYIALQPYFGHPVSLRFFHFSNHNIFLQTSFPPILPYRP